MDLRAGEKLAVARKRKGLTQAQLAEAAGESVSLYALREYEGGRRDIKADGLAAMCEILHLTTQEILGV